MFQLCKHHFRNNIFFCRSYISVIRLLPVKILKTNDTPLFSSFSFAPLHYSFRKANIPKKNENNGGYDSFHTLYPLLEDTRTYFSDALLVIMIRIIVFAELFFFRFRYFLHFFLYQTRSLSATQKNSYFTLMHKMYYYCNQM